MSGLKQTILVIDDSSIDSAMLQSFLSSYPYNVLTAETGEGGIALAIEHRPDLILLDILMPEVDGFEVLKRLKTIKEFEKIPVIFLTALNDDNAKIRAFESGAVDYISKPFNAREVAARVKTHLDIAMLTNSLDFLLKTAAHEFGIPLAVIDTSLQMQQMEFGESEYINAISSASATLQGVYKDMAYFLGSSSKKTTKPERIRLSDFVTNRVSYMSVLATAYGNGFEIDIEDDGATVYINESELERVVDNILSNAVKHSEKDGKVTVKVSAVNDKVMLEVKNKSRRIDNMARVFEEFYRDSRYSDGLGLGLYIARSICKKNGAEISGMCENGYAIFRVYFGRCGE